MSANRTPQTTSRTYISAAITSVEINTSRVAGPNPPHFAPRKNYFLLDTYTKRYTRIAPWLTLSACAGRGLLRAQHFSAPPRSRIAPCPTLGFQRLTRIAPCPALPALMLNPDCSVPGTSRPDAEPGLLRVQHLPLRSMHRLLRARPFAFRTGHELLRVRHLAFSPSARMPPCS